MSDYLANLTNGVYPGSDGQDSSIITGGVPTYIAPTPEGMVFPDQAPTTFTPNVIDDPVNGGANVSVVLAGTNSNYSNRTPLGLNESLLQDIVNSNELVQNGFELGLRDGEFSSYTGSDIKAIIEIGDVSELASTQNIRLSKQLIELSTVSISIHRGKSPARSLGFIGVKGYARGSRTIAGTMVFTQFYADILMKFLQSSILTDVSKDTNIVKIDQLPLFNMTLIFSNEYGFLSYRRILGIDFVTDGTIYSVHDMFSEQTITYVASDFTPLLPLDRTAKFTGISANEATAATILNKGRA